MTTRGRPARPPGAAAASCRRISADTDSGVCSCPPSINGKWVPICRLMSRTPLPGSAAAAWSASSPTTTPLPGSKKTTDGVISLPRALRRITILPWPSMDAATELVVPEVDAEDGAAHRMARLRVDPQPARRVAGDSTEAAERSPAAQAQPEEEQQQDRDRHRGDAENHERERDPHSCALARSTRSPLRRAAGGARRAGPCPGPPGAAGRGMASSQRSGAPGSWDATAPWGGDRSHREVPGLGELAPCRQDQIVDAAVHQPVRDRVRVLGQVHAAQGQQVGLGDDDGEPLPGRSTPLSRRRETTSPYAVSGSPAAA